MIATILAGAHAALTADAALLALLGGPHVHEHIPARARPPYLVLAVPVLRDWSTATETGAEAEMDVTTYDDASSVARLADIQARVGTALAFGNLAVPGHAVVNVEALPAAMERQPAADLLVGRQRFRVVIEPQGASA